MRRLALALLVSIGLFGFASPGGAVEAISFAAADGVTVYGDLYPGPSKAAPIVLLFHQAGSNRGEYAPIAPRLVALGFTALAIDQRSGGGMWARQNETIQHLGHSGDYSAALGDLEAALGWAKGSGYTGPVIVWGSSYSASLVFLLAAKHPHEIAAVLAFSPGEYLGGSDTVHRAAAQLQIPIFVTSAEDRGEIAEAKSILEAAKSARKVQFVPQHGGVHGSSTLRADRNGKGAEENWSAVEAFLKSVAPAQ